MKGQSRYATFFIFSPVLLYSTNAFIVRPKATIIRKRLPSCSIETSLHNDMNNLGRNEGPHNTFNVNGTPRGLNDPTFGDNYYFNGSTKPMNINQAHSKLPPQANNNSWNQNNQGATYAARTNYIDEGNFNQPTFGDNYPGSYGAPVMGSSYRKSPSTSTTNGKSSPWNSFNLSDKQSKPVSASSFNSSYKQNTNAASYTSTFQNGVPVASQTKNNFLHPDKFFTEANSSGSTQSGRNEMAVAGNGMPNNNFLDRDRFSTEAKSSPYSSSARNSMPQDEATKNNFLHPATYLNKANFGENKGYY